MSATVEQPALFAVVGVGAHVKVFHESGDLEGLGVVLASMTGEYTRGKLHWLVELYDGRKMLRPAARVVLNEDVTVWA